MSDWWTSDFQTTVDAYYRGDLAAGREACERLLSVDDLPDGLDLQTRRNLVFYAEPLEKLIPSMNTWPVDFPVTDGWSRFNPSIAESDDGFRMIVRSSNYTISRPLRYTINDEAWIIRTTNYLLDLSPDLEIRLVEPIADRDSLPDPPPFPVSGYEDCRLFHHCESCWVSATVRDRNPSGICQMALLRLEGVTPVEFHLLSDPANGRHEKNWMPAPCGDAGALRFIYSCYPTVVLRYVDADGGVAPEIIQPGPLIARRFSGGTQAIPIDGGRLCLVHEAVFFDDGDRIYTHRWVWFDPEWKLTQLSQPFHLRDRGIEFAAGLARRGDDLVISYGTGDSESWLLTVPIAEVLRLLMHPLDPEEVVRGTRVGLDAVIPTEVEFPSVMELPPHKTDPVMAHDESARPNEVITPFPAQRPTIASMTMTGNTREIIGDALRSVVDWVDWCLVVDTGISDDTLEITKEIAGDKLVLRTFPWQDDFSSARNFALKCAEELGADWAVTIDTDERLDVDDVDIHKTLAATDADVLSVTHANGGYGKERFFRLPARGHYFGPTHEAFIRETGWAPLPGVHFSELGKAHDQYRQKAERDVAILFRYTAERPDDPRWFYYLGDSLAGLGRDEEAIAAFRNCASLNGWDEEGAWALYRAAECFLKLDQPLNAVESCAAGMAKHAGLAELPWLAAYANWQADRPAQAVYWARQAIAVGNFAGSGASVPRVGFRHPPAMWEGPYDVLRYALRRLGDDAGADDAERLYHDALRARESGQKARVFSEHEKEARHTEVTSWLQ